MNRIASQAVVLTRLNYGEADRILTIMTPEHGKISVLAKGVRKPKSKLAGGLELFGVANILFLQGRSELKTLVSAHVHQTFGDIVKDIDRTMLGYDMLKFTHLYTEHDCEESYYVLIVTALQALNDAQIPRQVATVWFGARLLELSGHGLNMAIDANGDPLNQQSSYEYDFASMALRPAEHGPLTAHHIKFLRLAALLMPIKLASITGAGDIALQIEQIIMQCVAFYAR